MKKIAKELYLIAKEIILKNENMFDEMNEREFIVESGILAQNSNNIESILNDIVECRHSSMAKKDALVYIVNFDPTCLEILKNKNLARKIYILIKNSLQKI